MVERERELDQPRHTRSRLEMTDVGLGRADPQRRRGWTALTEDGGERRDLDRIADRGPGAMGLDIVDRGGIAPARAYACASTASWAGRFGAVNPFERPSWLTAPPRIAA